MFIEKSALWSKLIVTVYELHTLLGVHCTQYYYRMVHNMFSGDIVNTAICTVIMVIRN